MGYTQRSNIGALLLVVQMERNPQSDRKLPLVSVLFAIDRDK